MPYSLKFFKQWAVTDATDRQHGGEAKVGHPQAHHPAGGRHGCYSTLWGFMQEGGAAFVFCWMAPDKAFAFHPEEQWRSNRAVSLYGVWHVEMPAA